MTVRTSSMVFALSALSLGAVVLSQSAHIVPLTNKMSQLLGKAATFESLKDANIAELKQKVNAKYDGSPVEAVLEGLSLGSISLKSKPGAFEGRKFWMDYSDLTLAEVMDHNAEMANARWERSNSTYTLVPIDDTRQESDPSFAFASERNTGHLRSPVSSLPCTPWPRPGCTAPPRRWTVNSGSVCR